VPLPCSPGRWSASPTTGVTSNAATAVSVALSPQSGGRNHRQHRHGSGNYTVYTLTLPSGSWLATLTGQTVVTVYANGNVQAINNNQMACGNSVPLQRIPVQQQGALVLLADVQAVRARPADRTSSLSNRPSTRTAGRCLIRLRPGADFGRHVCNQSREKAQLNRLALGCENRGMRIERWLPLKAGDRIGHIHSKHFRYGYCRSRGTKIELGGEAGSIRELDDIDELVRTHRARLSAVCDYSTGDPDLPRRLPRRRCSEPTMRGKASAMRAA